MKAVVGLALSVALAGCAAPLAQDMGEQAPANYEAQIRARLVDDFVDPSSIRDAVISQPFPVNAVFDGVTPFPRSGWAVCLKANARNRMGGYTGRQPTLYLFQGGTVALMMNQGSEGFTQVSQHCERAIYRKLDIEAAAL